MKEQYFENRLYSFYELIEMLDIKESHVVEVLGKGCMLFYAPGDKVDFHQKLGVPESPKANKIFKLSDVISKKQSNED